MGILLPRSLAQGSASPYDTALHRLRLWSTISISLRCHTVECRTSARRICDGGCRLCLALFFPLGSIVYMRCSVGAGLRGAVLFWMATMSVTTLIPLNVLVNEHRLYLGTIGLCAVSVGIGTFLQAIGSLLGHGMPLCYGCIGLAAQCGMGNAVEPVGRCG